MVAVAAALSVCALIAKISWLQHQVELTTEWKHVLCVTIPVIGFVVLYSYGCIRLAHRYWITSSVSTTTLNGSQLP